MAIIKSRMQQRRTTQSNYDPSDNMDGEFVMITSGDPSSRDGRAVHVSFEPGQTKRLATYEDMVDDITNATDEVQEQFAEGMQTAIDNATDVINKVKKFFTDLKPHAFTAPVQNLTTNVAGSALDATMGKKLQDGIDTLNSGITHNWDLYDDEQTPISLAELNFANVGINTGGQITGPNSKVLISELIDIPNGVDIMLALSDITNLTNVQIYFYGAGGAFIASSYYYNIGYQPVLANSADAYKVRIRFSYSVDTLPSVLENNLSILFRHKKKIVSYSTGKNMFNPNDDHCADGYYIGSSIGGLLTSGSYGVTGFIPVRQSQKIIISPRFRQFLFYNTKLIPDASTWVGSATSNYVFTPPADGYIRFSYYIGEKASVQVELGETVTAYEPFKYVAQSNVIYGNSDADVDYSIGNVLYGKKWVVCGDSFTDGVLNTVIGEGKYADKRVVYPYLIGNRNDMDIVSFFLGGRTLAYPADPDTFTNSLTCPNVAWNYQNIPADADYITIYLGINDSHHEPDSEGDDGEEATGAIPLGTISDNTINTYYGAWNVVLTWLMTNRPFAHIGIIVSNGCDREAYRTAQIEIAQKYGVPYIDMNGDSRTPVMIRSKNPNIDSAVKTIINEKQRVSSSNMHPNDNAHIYESYFIENFLRSL